MARGRSHKTYEEEMPEMPMTTMIDCTFLLLIFFMLSCRFRSEDGKIDAHLPKDRGQGTGSATKDLQEVRVKLLWYNQEETNQRYHGPDGKVVLKVKERRIDWTSDEKGHPQPDWTVLKDIIEQKKIAYRPPADDSQKTQPVIIDARKEVPFYWVVRVLDTLVSVGITDISFAAEEIAY